MPDMDQDFAEDLEKGDVIVPVIVPADNREKSNMCNQCEYVSSQKIYLKRHLKIHSGEKSNKCNLCDFASSYASNLRTHLKTHDGEKTNKCNLCDFASTQAGDLRTHLKMQLEPFQ